MSFQDWLKLREMDTQPDEVLVQTAREGNREAMDTLLRRWTPKLTRWISKRVWDKHSVEDIVQNSIIKIIQSFQRGDVPENFGAWARTIVRNQSIDFGQKKKPVYNADLEKLSLKQGDKRMNTVTLVDKDPNDPATIFNQSRLESKLHKALQQMQDGGNYGRKKAEIIKAFYFDDDKISDISKKIGIPVGTVKRILHQGRKDLTKILTQQGLED
jgi:RNA polymerase sigma factor (sigma-70 family)